MDGSRRKTVAQIIARALLDAGADAAKLSATVDSFLRPPTSGQRYLMSPAQHRARAKQLRDQNAKSRAAVVHDLAAWMIEDRLAGPKIPPPVTGR